MAITYYAGNHWIGTASDRAGITTTNLIAGLMFLETDTDDMYQWDGDSWNIIAGDAIAQTLTNKTIVSPTLTTPQINDSASDHQYIFAAGNLAADRTVTLPVLTGGDTFVFNAHSQTLTNKTIVAGDNTLSGVVNANLSGSAAISNANLANSGITMAAESGSNDAIALGETFTFTAGEGIDTTMGTNAVTIAGEDASASNKGIASFSSNDFSVSSGAVTIKSGGVTNDQLAGSIANGKLSSSAITIGGTATSLGGTITALTALTDLDLTAGNKTIFDTVGANTLTIGAGNTTVTIAGNLTVSGTTNTISSNTVTIGDALILLNSDESGTPSHDSGHIIERGSSANVGFIWDESSDEWAAINTSSTGTEEGNVTISSYAGLQVGALTASSLLVGGVTAVTLTGTQTLTNKTLTAPTINAGTLNLMTALTVANDIDVGAYEVKALKFESDQATGTAPLTVASTTVVTNLNADLLDGVQGASYSQITGSETLTNKTLTAPILGTYMDFTKISAPSDPGTEVGRMYLKEIDANNNAVAIKVQKAGSIVEVEITSPKAVCGVCGSKDGAKDPTYDFDRSTMLLELYCGHSYEVPMTDWTRVA